MSPALSFFVLTFALSWVFWLPAALSGQDVLASWWAVAWLLGGFGPSMIAIILSARSEGRAELRDLWRRTVDLGRISVGWLIFTLLLIPVIIAMTAGIVELLGWPQASFQGLDQVLANPVILIGGIIIGVIAGPLSEELGWRGYALDHLQSKMSPLRSTLILGMAWWAWHIPLFFMRGTTQGNWGFFSLDSLFFLITIFPLSFIMTWVYNSTNRSILAAILLHFGFNFTLSFVLPASIQFDLIRMVLITLAAWVLVRFTSPTAVAPVPGAE